MEQGLLMSFSEWAARDKQASTYVATTILLLTKLFSLFIEDLLAKLSGGKYFSSLDMSQAYQQLPLDDESKKKKPVHQRMCLN